MALLVALSHLLVVVSFVQGSYAPVETKEILEKFGNGKQMNLAGMETLFKSVGLQVFNGNNKTGKVQVYLT